MRQLAIFGTDLEAVETLDGLSVCFRRFIEPFGFDAFTLGIAPLVKGKVDSNGAQLFSTLPQPFQEEYFQHGMEASDPMFDLMASRYQPFTKRSIEAIFDQAPHSRQVTTLAEKHGLGDALMIPMTTATRVRGVVLFCKDEAPTIALPLAAEGLLLHAASIRVMAIAEELGFGQLPSGSSLLSPRECECLQFAALGRSNTEIAAALGISERTVRFHLSNACSKLGTSRRSRAITLAIQQGLIRT